MSGNKEERLSFRITPEMSKIINDMVEKHDEIKHRSDFGIKALKRYMKVLEMQNDILSSVKDAIMALADEIGAEDLQEIVRLKEFIEMYDR